VPANKLLTAWRAERRPELLGTTGQLL
jgi:hypothetical protein